MLGAPLVPSSELTAMKTYTQGTRDVRARVGETFAFELQSQSGAGYRWEVVQVAGDIAVEEAVVAFGSQAAVGAGAIQRFVLDPRAVGSAVVKLAHKRAWETTPIAEHAIRVIIDP